MITKKSLTGKNLNQKKLNAMDKKIVFKILGVWFLLAIIATTNGIARNAIYKPIFGDLLAHQISTLILIIIIFLFSFFSLQKNFKDLEPKFFLLIGFVWLILTEAFEFLAGHYLFGNSWEKILGDYNIFAGRLWILVLLTICFSPIITQYFYSKIAEKYDIRL